MTFYVIFSFQVCIHHHAVLHFPPLAFDRCRYRGERLFALDQGNYQNRVLYIKNGWIKINREFISVKQNAFEIGEWLKNFWVSTFPLEKLYISLLYLN